MKNLKKSLNLFILCFILLFTLSACEVKISSTDNSSQNKSSETYVSTNGELKIHYIDVGQGDCELIQLNNQNLLIDTGSNQYDDKLLNYLKKQGVKKLDYVIATHPHEDHIGCMDDIINTFEIGTFYAPKKTSSTKTFERMIKALKSNDLKITPAKAGIEFILGDEAICKIAAPNSSSYEDTNDYSVILKITYGNTKFLFTGDAEAISEKEVVKNHYDIDCDVLKVGHHGSSSSSTLEFLKKATPQIAVISCGKDNKYGHPHKETIERLKKIDCKILRTDIEGTIILLSDGTTISKLK